MKNRDRMPRDRLLRYFLGYRRIKRLKEPKWGWQSHNIPWEDVELGEFSIGDHRIFCDEDTVIYFRRSVIDFIFGIETFVVEQKDGIFAYQELMRRFFGYIMVPFTILLSFGLIGLFLYGEFSEPVTPIIMIIIIPISFEIFDFFSLWKYRQM